MIGFARERIVDDGRVCVFCRYFFILRLWLRLRLSWAKMNLDIEKLDIDSIFTKYTINEIRDIEEKIKTDMEKKKEELRSMVGWEDKRFSYFDRCFHESLFFSERYRDLIEAADAIFEMKNCAKGVRWWSLPPYGNECRLFALPSGRTGSTFAQRQMQQNRSKSHIVDVFLLVETEERPTFVENHLGHFSKNSHRNASSLLDASGRERFRQSGTVRRRSLRVRCEVVV